MKWIYSSENFAGNIHQTAETISKHYPHWDVVTMQFSGNYTVVAYRTPVSEEPAPETPAKLPLRVFESCSNATLHNVLVNCANMVKANLSPDDAKWSLNVLRGVAQELYDAAASRE